MILDANNLDLPVDEFAGDIIIIGAGTVGLFLARCIAREKRQVILIDAGGRVADTSRNSQNARSGGKMNNGVMIGRASGLGGTSLLWGGQLAEFEESDLTDDDHRWPLSISELHGWYGVVYDHLGIGQPLSNAEYRRRLGGEVSGNQGVERFFTAWLPQPNFPRLFRQDIVSNPQITVILNATVNDIAFDGARAKLVRATTRSGRQLRIRGNDFVFASGTIETSRFFLSTQRHLAVPWKSCRHIGCYFQDHLGGRIADVEILNEKRFREYFENGVLNGIKFQPKLRMAPEARKRISSGVCGTFSFDSELSANLANIKLVIRNIRSGTEFSKLTTLIGDLCVLGRSLVPLVTRYLRDRRVMAFFDRAITLQVQAEQLPNADSKIVLTDDPILQDGLSMVSVNWRVDGREIESIRAFAYEADAYLQQQELAKLRIDPVLQRGDPDFLELLSDTYHQCGGMRMATTHTDGVVDRECRVWGTDNVYVAGAAVFPSSGHANSTLTALAMTARLASTLTS